MGLLNGQVRIHSGNRGNCLVFIFLQFLRWQVDKTDLEKSYEILSANIGYNPRERTHNLTLPTDGNAAI